MSGFSYPVDVADLSSRLKARQLEQSLGVEGARDDQILTAVVWSLGQGWFPVFPDATFHGAADIGLPDGAGDTFLGANVLAVADGEVVYEEAHATSEEGYDFGRVVLRCQHPEAGDVYVLYQHLGEVTVAIGQDVKQGDVVGRVGWHGLFPHLHFAIASTQSAGGDQDLTPACDREALPSGDGVWNVHRVQASALDPSEWPGVPAGSFTIYNPIEFVRYTQGLEYQHDIGTCAPHAVDPAPTTVPSTPGPGEDHEVSVERVLQSKVLHECEELEKLAHDPEFAPVAQGANGDVVNALQRGFKAAGFDVGRFGPDSDGIDGDFGKTMVRVVKKFQTENLPKLPLGPWAPANGVADGAIDHATLLGLDLLLSGMEKAPAAEPEKAPERAKEPPAEEKAATPPPPSPVVVNHPDGEFVFDGYRHTPSIAFGMRMYKALLGWEVKVENGRIVSGCGYSTADGSAHEYQEEKANDQVAGEEWPDMGGLVPSFGTDAKDRKRHRAFGVAWTASGYTNCCNSQMAALAAAIGSTALKRKDTNKDIIVHTFVNDLRTVKDGDASPITTATTNGKLDPLKIFQGTFVTAANYKLKDGTDVQKAGLGGMINAIEFLGIGTQIQTATDDRDAYLAMRLGDPAHYHSHAWLVGDVRYGIWLEDGQHRDRPDYVIDQSAFVDAAKPTLVKLEPKKRLESLDAGKRLTADDCDWLIRNEVEFEKRLTEFLGGATVAIDGVDRPVKRVTVMAWQVFSANCIWFDNEKHADQSRRTFRSKIFVPDGADWKHDAEETSRKIGSLGVTRRWDSKSAKISFGRYYGATP